MLIKIFCVPVNIAWFTESREGFKGNRRFPLFPDSGFPRNYMNYLRIVYMLVVPRHRCPLDINAFIREIRIYILIFRVLPFPHH